MKQLLLPLFFVVLLIGCGAPVHDNVLLKKDKENKTMTSDIFAVIKTNMGTVKIKLFPEQAPMTVENFVGLAKKGYYNGIIFHRIIDNFMIQGGDPTGTGRGGESLWGKKFKDEFSPSLVFDKEGILAMANAGPGTNGSQFFITLAPTPWLNNHHTIFGQVVEGMYIVHTIGKVRTGAMDKPVNEVKMESVTIEEPETK